MASNYPPGVTGMEYEIAGPDFEEEAKMRCWQCSENVGYDMEQEGTIYGYKGERWFICSICDTETTLEPIEIGE